MRTLTTIIAIIFILAGGSFISHDYIQKTTHSLISQLETVEQSSLNLNWKKAQMELDTAQEHWDKKQAWWTILLNHQEIDTIDLSMERLKKYLVTEDKSLSLGEISTLKLLFEHIADSDLLNLKNIL